MSFIYHLRIVTTLQDPHSGILGTAGLVFYIFPYLGIMFAPLLVFYFTAAIYYRRTSVETKRLDSLMRSALYASYSGESLLLSNGSANVGFRNLDWIEHRSRLW